MLVLMKGFLGLRRRKLGRTWVYERCELRNRCERGKILSVKFLSLEEVIHFVQCIPIMDLVILRTQMKIFNALNAVHL